VTGLCGGGGVESERAATTIGVANEFGCWDSLLRALRGKSSNLYTRLCRIDFHQPWKHQI